MNLFLYLRTQWDRALALLAVISGVVVLLLGYIGTRDAVLVEQQMPYILSGGLVGLFLLAVGAVLWLSADLRDDWRELRELKTQVTRLADIEERKESANVRAESNFPASGGRSNRRRASTETR